MFLSPFTQDSLAILLKRSGYVPEEFWGPLICALTMSQKIGDIADCRNRHRKNSLLSLKPTLLATLALFLTNTLPSQTKSPLNPATITFVNFAVSASATATSIVHSKLDYYNSRYHNLPNYQLKWLQQIENSLARAVIKAPKSSHITPILKSF